MENRKQIIMTGLVLMAFAILGGALVGATYQSTAERIAENMRQIMLDNLNQIISHDQYDNSLLDDTVTLAPDERLGQSDPSTAYLARKDGKVTAVIFNTIAPDGYAGAIKLLVGINAGGSITGVRVLEHQETPGLGDNIELSHTPWILSFDHKSLEDPGPKGWKVKRDGGSFDQFTGATISPRAVVKAVHNTLLYFRAYKDRLLNTPAPVKQPDKKP